MNSIRVLLRAYYERLHERMEANRTHLVAHLEALLPAEIARQGFGPMTPDQVQAYREACLAFVDERLETYNPVGIQYPLECAAEMFVPNRNATHQHVRGRAIHPPGKAAAAILEHLVNIEPVFGEKMGGAKIGTDAEHFAHRLIDIG